MAFPGGEAAQVWIHVAEPGEQLVLLPAEAPGVTRVGGRDETLALDALLPGEQQDATLLGAREQDGIPSGGSEPGATLRVGRKQHAALFAVSPPERHEVPFVVQSSASLAVIPFVMVRFWLRARTWARFLSEHSAIQFERCLFATLFVSSELFGFLEQCALLRLGAPQFEYSFPSEQSSPSE